ncbi:glycosyltransferase family 4 protein [Candidatus Parcubacteria bacterium]|nr:glycosyltransferase family 4 protein [Candidatus Parcubacteria bacterium]
MRFIYLNGDRLYPQDAHLIQGLRELNHEVVVVGEKKGALFYQNLIQGLKESVRNKDDIVIIGYSFPLLAIRARFAVRNRIFFNAVSSQYEANVISRGEGGLFFTRGIKSWLVDLISFHASTKVLVESDAQREFVSRRFFISKKKLVRSFSGVDESHFFYESGVPKLSSFTVLFRGRFLPESGILTVLEAAKKLENTGIIVRIVGAGFLYREVNAAIARLQPKNLEMINETLSFDDLRTKMLECHVSLGQLADHPRLDRTLPCKLFESLALKLPYLTGRNKAAFEILEEGATCIASNPGDADDLAKKILYVRDNPEIREKIALAGYELYKAKLTSKALAREVLDACLK